MPNTPTSQIIDKHSHGYNLSLALNYDHAAGSLHLLRFVNWKRHPKLHGQTELDAVKAQLADMENRILSRTLMDGAQVTKGSLFDCNQDMMDQLHFQMTFAAAPEDDLVEGMKIFASAVIDEFS